MLKDQFIELERQLRLLQEGSKEARTPRQWLDECQTRFSEIIGVNVTIDNEGNFIPEAGVILDPAIMELKAVKDIKQLVAEVIRESGLERRVEGRRK